MFLVLLLFFDGLFFLLKFKLLFMFGYVFCSLFMLFVYLLFLFGLFVVVGGGFC